MECLANLPRDLMVFDTRFISALPIELPKGAAYFLSIFQCFRSDDQGLHVHFMTPSPKASH
jgi:hypothetical protein